MVLPFLATSVKTSVIRFTQDFFYILPGITNGIQGYFRGMGEMKTTLTATFIQISIRALVVAVLVPRIGLNGAAWACAVGWSAMLCYTFARYRRVREHE